jgi:hypothetical protein
MLRTGVKIQELVDQEKARLAALESKSAANQSNAEAALAEYGPVSCSNICAKIFEKFPREVRDIIYGHVLPDKPVAIAYDPDYLHGGDWGVTAAYSDSNWDRLHPYLGSPKYVNRTFTIELVEHHYRTSTFTFPVSGYTLIHLRTKDKWNLGFRPVDFMLNVSVPISCQHFSFTGILATPVNQPTTWPGQGYGWSHYGQQKMEALCHNLEALFGFRPGTKITIHLEVHTDWLPSHLDKAEWECDNVVPIIFPTLRRLVLGGAKVKVCLENEGCILAVPHSGCTFDEMKKQFEKVRLTQLRI